MNRHKILVVLFIIFLFVFSFVIKENLFTQSVDDDHDDMYDSGVIIETGNILDENSVCNDGSVKSFVIGGDHNNEIVEGEELPPRERISIMDVIYPRYTIDEKNTAILDKILSGNILVLQSISYADYIYLIDLMNEYRYYVFTKFTSGNSNLVDNNVENSRYLIFRESYKNAFISFAYALFNSDENIVINAFIHLNEIGKLCHDIGDDYLQPIRRDFLVNLDCQSNDRIKMIHLKFISILDKMMLQSSIQSNPQNFSTLTKDDFRLIYASSEEELGSDILLLADENDMEYLIHGLENQHLSIVYFCLKRLNYIYETTSNINVKNSIKFSIGRLSDRINEYDLFLGEAIYELSSEF